MFRLYKPVRKYTTARTAPVPTQHVRYQLFPSTALLTIKVFFVTSNKRKDEAKDATQIHEIYKRTCPFRLNRSNNHHAQSKLPLVLCSASRGLDP